ncbi:CAP domain-containing protein [Streptomyces sp. NPDC097619]|uniref:CAP domain-containing protein n=1 Tax=Streptomyces sp. NPDC097619 TaxID=3157228 RepID=UPI00332AEBA3
MGRHRSTAPRRGKGKRPAPVRTGLLGVTAAAALGVVAVASGLVPVGGNFALGGSSAEPKARSAVGAKADPQGRTEAQGGTGGLKSLTDSAASTAPSGAERRSGGAPSKSPSAKPKPTAGASKTPAPTPSKAAPTKAAPAPAPSTRAPEPVRTTARPTAEPEPPRAPSGDSAEAAVLALVNQERAAAGCRPVRQNPPLAALAGAFSKDMAERGFFDHTDPDGANPWDRASKAGISGLGGENIARGQADAEAVMASWMDSPGHRANILNCDFRTLGVGVHFASGGPWWTQDFGF